MPTQPEEDILYFALENAITYQGKTKVDKIISRLIAKDPKNRQKLKELLPIIKKIVDEVNLLTPSEQRSRLLKINPKALDKKVKQEEKLTLPPLPNWKGKVRTRFAPNPSGAPHIGYIRPIYICYEYAKMYSGEFILRLEDTDPKTKKPILEAYDWMPEYCKWLGAPPDEFYIQSERLEIYYDYATQLIEKQGAYVCTCNQDTLKKNRLAKKACEHRNYSIQKNLELWKVMLDGGFKEGEAILRIKTNIRHKNPSIRDWPAFRVLDTTHPRLKQKHYVWPLYNFSATIDDHLMKITHVFRMVEHIINTQKQMYIYNYFNWKPPIFMEFGSLMVQGMPFHKSEINKFMKENNTSDYSDVRLPTLLALKKRGFQPQALRKYALSLGLSPINAFMDWDRLAKYNREEIDNSAPRYYFIPSPIKAQLYGLKSQEVKLKKHPTNLELGARKLKVIRDNIFLPILDIENLKKGDEIRLKDFIKIKFQDLDLDNNLAKFELSKNQELEKDETRIQWLPAGEEVKSIILTPTGENIHGLVESSALDYKDVLQFERVGFVKLDNKRTATFLWTHK